MKLDIQGIVEKSSKIPTDSAEDEPEDFAPPAGATPDAGAVDSSTAKPESISDLPEEPPARKVGITRLSSEDSIDGFKGLSLSQFIGDPSLLEPDVLDIIIEDLEPDELKRLKVQLAMMTQDKSGNLLTEEDKKVKAQLINAINTKLGVAKPAETPPATTDGAGDAGAGTSEGTEDAPKLEVEQPPKYLISPSAISFLEGITKMSDADLTAAEIEDKTGITTKIEELRNPHSRDEIKTYIDQLKTLIPTDYIPHHIFDSWVDNIVEVK